MNLNKQSLSRLALGLGLALGLMAGAAAQTAREDLRPERRVERRVSGGVPLVGGRLLQRRGRLDFRPAGKADPDEVVEAAGLEAHGEG